ncbi:MAG TPA: glycosyltransferase, partial [Spirochaetia bacterium]|nr:glycosyltransferase [Spirochaetia bacterium]
PVYVGFGSMLDRVDGEKTVRVVVEGLKRTGRRGIISGVGKLEDLPPDVLAIDAAPHAWLFPRMAAVCHHGGAGTSAAGFRAGVPSIIVPFALDQFAWARRSFELGVGAPPIPAKRLTAEGIAGAVRYATRDEVVEKAQELGRKIATENGAHDSAKVIAEAILVGS